MVNARGNPVDEHEPKLEGKYPEHDLRYLLDRTDPVEYESDHDEIVIFSTRNHAHHNYLYPLLAYPLTEQNIPTYFMFYHPMISRTFPDLQIDRVQVSNSLRKQEHPYLFRSGQIGYPRFDWDVELDNEQITVGDLENINFFPTFIRTLQNDYQVYNIDFSDPEVARKVQRGLFTADEIVRYCQLLYNFAQREQITIKIIGWESSYLPHGLFNQFCLSDINQENRLEYINIGTQYGHYFRGIDAFPYYIGACNHTRRSTFRKYSGFDKEHQKLFERTQNDQELLNEIQAELDRELKQNIFGISNKELNLEDEDPKGLKSHIERTHQSDRNVFCLFSHQFYDVPLYDHSELYDDMCEWIDDTIDIFSDREDLLILKPHPGESGHANEDNEPNTKLAEYIRDVSDIENIILTDPGEYSSITIYNHIDCGLVWRSTVGIEMTLLGVPTIVGGRPYWDEFFEVNQPTTRDEYIDLIEKTGELTVEPETQTRASVYLYFLKNYLHNYVPYIKNLDYSALDLREIRWDKEKLDEFMESGDTDIYTLLDELMLEGFESGLEFDEKLSEPFSTPDEE
jgi:hypothetical protein